MKFGVSYFGSRILKHVIEDLKSIKSAGFNYVVHTVTEFDLEYRYSNIQDIVQATQDLGLEAHVNPWGIGNVFGGEPFSNFVSHHYLDACQVLDDDSIIPMACPNAPAFVEYMKKWVTFVVSIRADAVFWDEPHFHQQGFLSSVPGRWGCHCQYCQKGFHQLFGCTIPKEENLDIQHFKQASLKNFLECLMQPLTENHIKNTLYLTANVEPTKAKFEWEHFADIQYLNTLSTGPYWIWQNKPIETVAEYSETISSLCLQHNLESQIWIQSCKIPKGREKEIQKAVKLAVDSGIKDLAFWGFEGGAHETWISCEDPYKAWERVTAAIGIVRS